HSSSRLAAPSPLSPVVLKRARRGCTWVVVIAKFKSAVGTHLVRRGPEQVLIGRRQLNSWWGRPRLIRRAASSADPQTGHRNMPSVCTGCWFGERTHLPQIAWRLALLPGRGRDYLGPRSLVSRAGLPPTALYSCRFGLRLGLPWEPVVGIPKRLEEGALICRRPRGRMRHHLVVTLDARLPS